MATGNFRDIKAAMHRRAMQLEPELKKGIAECTRILWAESKAQMDALIYAQPPDTVSKYTIAKPEEGRTKRGRMRKGFTQVMHFGQLTTVKLFTSAPVKGRRGGRGYKWTQTGKLKRAETKQMKGLEGIIINAVRAKSGGGGYAHARHNLGLSAGDPNVIPPPPSRKRKTRRQAPFRAIAIRNTEERRREILRGRVQKVLSQ